MMRFYDIASCFRRSQSGADRVTARAALATRGPQRLAAKKARSIAAASLSRMPP